MPYFSLWLCVRVCAHIQQSSATPCWKRVYGGFFLARHIVLQRIEVAGVLLHHDASLVEGEGAVVGSSNLVFLHVSQLNLAHIRTNFLLIQEAAVYCSEAVDAHFTSVVATAQTAQETDAADTLGF